jgi:hypothetical protein
VDTGSAAVLRQDQEQARADVAIGGRGRVFLALKATGEGYLPLFDGGRVEPTRQGRGSQGMRVPIVEAIIVCL